MRTNIVIDNDLMDEALRYSDAKTKREVVDKALREFVENRKRKDLRELRGKIEFAEGYDYKSTRRS
jgi:Arc/MetJ family transcription regulator